MKELYLLQVFSEEFPLVAHQRDTLRLATLLWDLPVKVLKGGGGHVIEHPTSLNYRHKKSLST